jgi:hypothetical protein
MNFDSPWVIALLVIAAIAFLIWLWGAIDRYHMRCAIREASLITYRQNRPRPVREDAMNPWQRAIDEALIVNCVDCTHVGESPEQALARLIRVEIQMAELHKPRQDLVPGVMHCAKCNFQLTRTTLCVADGNAYAGNNDTEPCPNGCGPLWPVTWEQEARSCWKGLERMHERVAAAEKAVAELEAKKATVLEFPKS